MHPTLARIPAAVVLLVGAACAQKTLIVDERGTGGAFTDIQLAVNAASNGDTILVRKGTYSGASLFRKSLKMKKSPSANAGVGTSEVRLGVLDESQTIASSLSCPSPPVLIA